MANSVVEEIKSRINIVDFIGQYLKLTKAGVNWKANCPFHNEKSPSFMVNEEKQIYHCFGCGKGGDIFGFLMEMDALDFKEALKVLADKSGVPLTNYKPEVADNKNKVLDILELATKFYETQLWKGAGKDKIINYLHERGLKDEAIKEFRLGYAPAGWRNLLKFLLDRGYKIEDIAKTGLLVEKEAGSLVEKYYDRFRDRVTFPVSDIMGKVVGFSARVAPGRDESQAKYVNTPETVVYHKSKILYGIDKAKKEIKDKNEVVLVEGNMDVIASAQAGIKNVAAISGTALTPEQLEILRRYAENIKIFFDMDSAGEAATKRSAEIVFQKGLNLYIIVSREGKDAAEIVEKNPKLFLDAVEKAVPAMEYFLGKLMSVYDKNKAADKKKIVEEALEFIKNIGNEIEKNHWVKKLSRELDVDEKMLLGSLRKIDMPRNMNVKLGTAKEDDEFSAKPRGEMIRNKIIGLALAYPEIWKELVDGSKEDDFLEGDEYFQILLQNGNISDFQIGKLLVIIKDENTRKLLQKLAFDNRYQFNEKIGVDEFEPEQAMEQYKQCAVELKKEIKKRKLEVILKDIKKAEESGNKEELQMLMEEFGKLSKELK
jgi:DNA primase